MKGAPLAEPTSVTAQFKRFFDCGRAVRCMLPLGSGRFMHLVVLYGYQRADHGPEQLALTEQLRDAALGELRKVARGQPCLIGDINVEPTKIPCLAKGISAGLWVDFEGIWALAAGSQPTPTCKRDWYSTSGHRRDFMVGCPLAVAAVLSCKVQPGRWIAAHLAVRTLFDCCRWTCRDTQPVQRTPLWPASWLPAVDKSRSSKSVEVQRVWEVYERLQTKKTCLAKMLYSWMSPLMQVMSLVHGLSGLMLLRLRLLMLISSVVDPFLTGVWFLAGSGAVFQVVKLGGHKVRMARGKMLLMSSCTVILLLLPCLI